MYVNCFMSLLTLNKINKALDRAQNIVVSSADQGKVSSLLCFYQQTN